MKLLLNRKILNWTFLVVTLVLLSVGMVMGPGIVAYSSNYNSTASPPSTLPGRILVSAPPAGSKGADDIARLPVNGLDFNKPLIWTAYQNGINADGTPGISGGPIQSTVAGYDPSSGAVVRIISVTVKVDGLTSDHSNGKLIATVNEDNRSAFNLIYPALGAVATYTYNPNPAVSGNGGTDSIAIKDGNIYVAHSNPNDVTQATDYLVNLDRSTLTATLTPVFYDNSVATDAVSGKPVQLALTDPDTNYIMPSSSSRFAGDLATISQGDGKIVFASNLLSSSMKLQVLNLTDNKPGNMPPIDGFAVATSNSGTLYVVDNKGGTISALDTAGWPAGTVFVGEPSDNGNPLIGTLNLWTGKITPLGNSFVSPKGLLFVPHDDKMNNGGGESGIGGIAVRDSLGVLSSLPALKVNYRS